MDNSFAQNVNHVASLDKQYGLALTLSKNNVLLPSGFTYSFSGLFEIYNRNTMITESVTATGLTMGQMMLNLKTAIETGYPLVSVVMTADPVGTGALAVTMGVSTTGGLNQYYLKNVTLEVKAGTTSKYIIKSTTVNPIEMLPSVANLSAGAIDAVVPILTNINAINNVSTNMADVIAVSTNSADVDTVATNILSVNSVKNAIDTINTVAASLDDVSSVATDILKVSSVADNMVKVSNLDTNMAKISTVDGNMNDINAIATDIIPLAAVGTNINSVLAVDTNIAAVNTVSTNIASVNSVSSSISAVNTLNTNLASITNLDLNIADIGTVVANMPDINAVVDNMLDIDLVVANMAAINNIETNMSSVVSTHTNIASVNSVATNMSDVNQLSNNMLMLMDISANMPDIDLLTTNIAKIDTISTNMATINSLNTNMTALNSINTTVVPNMAEVLASAANANIASTKATASSISASASATSAGQALTSATNSANSAITSGDYAADSAASALASQVSADASASSALASSTSATNSEASKVSSVASAAAAAIKASEAESSRIAAVAAEAAALGHSTSSSTFSNNSLASSLVSKAWSETAHNLPVSGVIGVDAAYSAYHWAVEAGQNTASDIIRDDLTTLTTAWSSSKLAPMIAAKSDTTHNHDAAYEAKISVKGTAFNRDFAGSGVSDLVAKSDHLHAGAYEPVITKNTGFNKPIGTTGNDVAAGDHLHDSQYMAKEVKQSAYNARFVLDPSNPLETEVPRGTHTHSASSTSFNNAGARVVKSTTVQGALNELDAIANTFTTAEKCYMTVDLTDPSYVVDIVAKDAPIIVQAGMTILNSNNSLYSNGIIINYAEAPNKLIQGEFFATLTVAMTLNTKYSLVPLVNGVVDPGFNIGSSVGSDTSSLVGNVQISANGFISGLSNGDVVSVALVNNSNTDNVTIYGMTMSFSGQPEGAVVASGLSISHVDVTDKGLPSQHPTSSIYDAGSGTALNVLLNNKINLIQTPVVDNFVVLDANGSIVDSGIAKTAIGNSMSKVALPVVDTIVVMDATGNSKKGTKTIEELALANGDATKKFSVLDGTAATDAVNKGQIDALSSTFATASSLSSHVALVNPHNTTAASVGAAALVHAHEVSDVTGLQDSLSARYLKVSNPVTGNIVTFAASGVLADGGAPYAHPTTDGFLHVPATGIISLGKVLTAGATAGSFAWMTPTTGGTVTNVTGTAPISVATGTTTPVISMAAATALLDGYMTSAYASKLDGIAAGAQVNVSTDLTVTAGTTAGPTINSSTGADVVIPSASGTASGVVTTGAQIFAGAKTFESVTASDLTVSGNLTVNGTASVINSSTLTVDDKNIEIGSVTTISGVSGTVTSTALTTTITGTVTTGMIIGQTISKVSGTGAVGTGAVITSIDSATQITITSSAANTAGGFVFNVGGASDTTADGGGITLKGLTDKVISWLSSNLSWNFTENINLVLGKTFKINGTDVLSGTALGSGVVNSSLTSVGTIATGSWNATAIPVAKGGTGATTSTGTGSVVLHTSPTLVTPMLGVATGTSFNSITALASVASPMNGTAAVGTGTTVARQDHVHASDTTRAAIGQTFFLGTTSVAINRTTGALALTGITSIDGNAATATTATTANALNAANAYTGTSFNSITGLASVAPVAPAVTAAVGTSTTTARQDHVHPTNFTATATDIKMDGAQAVGILTTFPRADHVHPTDTTRAPLESPVFTGNVTGLGISTGTSFNAITGLASVASPVNGVEAVGTSTTVARQDHVHGTDTTRAADNTVVHLSGAETITGIKTFTAQPVGILKDSVGLANVDNTSDLNKPLSTATTNALELKVSQDAATGSATIPSGTTAQRTASPNLGNLRYNTELASLEVYSAGVWGPVGSGGGGGTVDLAQLHATALSF